MLKAQWSLLGVLTLGLLSCDSDSDKDPLSSVQDLVIARVSGNGQEARVGRALSSPLVILFTNSQGTPVANHRVDFVIIEGDGRLSVESTVSDEAGRGTVRVTLGDEPGVVRVRASVFGFPSEVVFALTGVPSDVEPIDDGGATGSDQVNILRVDGRDDWVRVRVPSLDHPLAYPGTGGWSMEIWAKPASRQSVGVVAGQASINDSPKDPYYIEVWQDNIFIVQDNLGSGAGSGTVSERPTVGEWTHFAGTFEDGAAANTLRYYMNGELKGESSTQISIGSRGSEFDPFAIGSLASFGSTAGFAEFHGDIDEVRIWSRTLSEDDIQANMRSELTGTEEGLVGYWNFNGLTTDGRVPDITDNGSHGELLFDAQLVYSADAPVP